jgi:hypothetical protein
MRNLLSLGLVIGISLLAAGCAETGARVGVGFGVAPVCPYGYYETSPYGCAPDGYYGPEWFSNGLFIGAGPWYRGPARFYGHVDHDLDYRRGFRGTLPPRGAAPGGGPRREFHGQAMHDPRGHEGPRGRR